MKEIISLFKKSAEIKVAFAEKNAARIEQAAEVIVNALQKGGKILLFGNGGSAADAQHIAAEFVNRFLLNRAPFPAVALSTDTSVLTSIGNDLSFDEIFSRQIAALGKPGDISWGITTSGKSPNIIRAFEVSRELGLMTIGFTGKDGGAAASLVDYNFNVETGSTPRIQETHITLAHVICELVERRMQT